MIFLLGLALASEPAAPTDLPSARPLVDPTLESANVVSEYAAWARANKLKGAASEIVCSPFAEGLSMCFTRRQGADRVYYTAADRRSAEDLLTEAKGAEDAAVEGLEAIYVADFTPPYYLVAGNSRADAAMLFPDALERKLGGKCVVAVPAMGVLIAWIPGDLDFDKVVGVGVKRAYDTLPNPVSSMLYTWNGASWVVWGQARQSAP
ncbi:MAG: hypothetical protein EXR69_07885 [Myxococcales bacterium]|nr:hypothetical protein [Myxococcales bacterium]